MKLNKLKNQINNRKDIPNIYNQAKIIWINQKKNNQIKNKIMKRRNKSLFNLNLKRLRYLTKKRHPNHKK